MCKRYFCRTLVMLAVLALVLTACGPAATPTPTQPPPTAPKPTKAPTPTTPPEPTPTPKPKQIIIGAPQEPENLNPPLAGAGQAAWEVSSMIFDPLVRVNDKGEYMPMLAKEVPTLANGGASEDFATWTFKLRDDVKWHDGQPFSSADVAFTLGVIQDETVNVTVSRSSYEGVTVETPDATTVIFHLPKPNTTFLELWAYSGIAPKHVLEGVDINTAAFNTAPKVGTGPFKFVEWVSGSHITVEKNPDYYLGKPAVDRIIYRIIPSTDVLLSMMETGEIDMRFLVSTEHVPVVQNLSGWKLYSTPAYGYFHFFLNLRDPILSDPGVRHAMAAALDKELICKTILGGLVEPHWSPLPRPSWAWVDVDYKDTYNPNRAKEMLEEAGWVDEDGDGVREKDGVRLSLGVSNIAGDVERDRVVQAVQQMWADVGIEVTVDPLELAAWVDRVRKCDHQIAYARFLLNPEPDSVSRYWTHDGGLPIMCLPDWTPYETFLTQGRTATDPDARRAAYSAFQNLAASDLPDILMYNQVFFDAVKDNILNFKPNSSRATNIWNVWEWDVQQ